MYNSFSKKWSAMQGGVKEPDETSLFVEPDGEPMTQRQLNLYYYFIFIKEILEKQGVKNVLEVGCGRGTISLYLALYLGLNVTLLDNDANAIEVAKKEFIRYGVLADFKVADALQTNLSQQSYDAVVSIGLAEHILEVSKLFFEQYRLLKPGGVMISLNVPKKFSIQYLNRPFRFFQKLRGQFYGSVKKDYYRSELKAKDYISIAKEVGFKQVTVTEVCPFPIYTPLNVKYDKYVTAINKWILKIRKLFLKYPYKTNHFFSQAHFLVGYK